MKKTILLCLVLFAFVGCSQVSYVEPINGPVSKVRFATNSSGVTLIKQYDNERCENGSEMFRLRNGTFMNTQERTLEIPLNSFRKEAYAEVLNPAMKTHHLFFHITNFIQSHSYSCGVYASHKFTEDKSYELYSDISVKLHKLDQDGKILRIDPEIECRVDLVEIIGENSLASKKKLSSLYNLTKNMTSECANEINQLY